MIELRNSSSDEYASNFEERRKNRLKDSPLISSILIAILVGIFLQMTWIIGVQELVGTFTSDILTMLIVDFGFRMTMGVILVFLIIPLLFGYHRKDAPLKEYGEHMRVNRGVSITKTILAGVLPLLGFILLMLILALLTGMFNPDLGVLIDDYRWFVFFLALVPGIWEELAFRGMILTNLEQRFSQKTSVLISAVLFGLFHFSNLVKDDLVSVTLVAIMATAFGIGWGYIVVKSNSVLPAIFIHYAVDVVLIGPLFVDANLATDASILMLVMGLTILFPLVCVMLAKMLFRNEDST
jgi:membrane protease YdiL (CAAX protease family)